MKRKTFFFEKLFLEILEYIILKKINFILKIIKKNSEKYFDIFKFILRIFKLFFKILSYFLILKQFFRILKI